MATLDPNACRAALASLLSGITGVGRVYPHRRLTRDDREIANLYVSTTGVINAWMISFNFTNAAINEKKMGFNAIGTPGGGTVYSTFQFQLEGYYGVNDATDTEETFANLCWLIAQTLNSYGGLSVPGLVEMHPCQIAQIGYAWIARKVFTHYAKLTIGMAGRTQ
jgi:hypothetical protein